MLFKCFLKGSCNHLGLDLSSEAINLAIKTAEFNSFLNFDFRVGGIEELKNIPSNSFDGAIISRVLDNVMPIDVIIILTENGKLLVILNPYLSSCEIEEMNVEREGDLIIEESSIYLYNLSTDNWIKNLNQYFHIDKYVNITLNEKDFGRIFLLVKN